MTEVLHSSSSSSSSHSSPSPSLSCAPSPTQSFPEKEKVEGEGDSRVTGGDGEEQLSLLAVLVALLRRSFGRNAEADTMEEALCGMEIGWPSNVRHVAHVTFDRFNGFLGLPIEFEPEVPTKPPSASATVFGVSTESMQLSYDPRGNSVPSILLLMQSHLYAQGGLQLEGIFRINGENSQEEYVRDQLNRGVVPEGIDVHCLAGLIKAWFRELPSGIMDSLSPEEVMKCESEDDCAALVRLLPSSESALLDWAINLMADVVQQEHLNKMNARNIAMVFAPNMTQMADPLNALMYAVQVMNFLKTLIAKRLREREDKVEGPARSFRLEASDENRHHQSSSQPSHHQSPSQPCVEEDSVHENEETEPNFIDEEPPSFDSSSHLSEDYKSICGDANLNSTCTRVDAKDVIKGPKVLESIDRGRIGESSVSNLDYKGIGRINGLKPVEKSEGLRNLSRISSRIERIEEWQ